jgi:ribosomal protein S26
VVVRDIPSRRYSYDETIDDFQTKEEWYDYMETIEDISELVLVKSSSHPRVAHALRACVLCAVYNNVHRINLDATERMIREYRRSKSGPVREL